MNPQEPASLQAELLDDFYTECDEHLSNIRQQTLAIESAASANRLDRDAVDSCFRSMHSLKGNAAIVGLRSAEELAHLTESILRGWLRAEVAPRRDGIELVATAAQKLEQIVSAHRLKVPLPDPAEIVAALKERQAPAAAAATRPVAPTAIPAPVSPTGMSRQEKVIHARERGLRTWRCIFSPSQELDRRGVNINAVRARLGANGEILDASPIIGEGGSMQFEFLVGMREDPADLPAWSHDGMELEPIGGSTSVEVRPANPAPPPASGAPSSSEAGSASLFIAPSHVVRVDLSRLDDLMRITGEMVIHRSRLEERIGRQQGDTAGLNEISIALARSLRELREALTRVRLVPVAEIFTRMPFVVRDLARDSGKRVRLQLEGQQTEIDKYLVERLKEPLLHLVRNAISHGVETPADRVAAGKPEEATLVLRAEAIAHSVVIRIRDDGRGIDEAAVITRARAAGIEISESPDEHELLQVLCQPGFSTRDEADRAAGRGVGMAVVQNAVRELGGALTLESSPGAGTQFTIRLPLTLSIAETFVVSAADQVCAVPQEFVHEVLLLDAKRIDRIHGVEVIPYRDSVLPLLSLRTMFNAPVHHNGTQPPVLVLATDRGLVGLIVDRVVGRREVVVRAMQDPLIQVPGVSGATELGDGRPVLILEPTALTARLTRHHARQAIAGARTAAPATH